MPNQELKLLKSLARQYPTIAHAATEIINLQSILNLPKGTEHFLTDIHGAHEQFLHVLKNGSGSVRRKIDDEFGDSLSSKDKRALATLIYYPREKLELVMQAETNMEEWYKITLQRLIQVCKRAASRYTRSKVRKAMPPEFAFVIEELITEKAEVEDKVAYYHSIIDTIIRIERAPNFIVALCNLIQRLVVDHLHIIGDIFDRGPGPHIIMDHLLHYHSVDFQWGNHDILWMGAASGSTACIANLIRIQAKYGYLDMLEEAYGINLLPLATFALETYGNDPCSRFAINYDGSEHDARNRELEMKMHKAITVIQLKLEGQLIQRRKDFGMDDRMLLDKIDYHNGTVSIRGKDYQMEDAAFPTIDPLAPYALCPEEERIVNQLKTAFLRCDKLQSHVRLLFGKGKLYKVYNSNLLYHGCIPLNPDGSFTKVTLFGKKYSGKALCDLLESYARKGFYSTKDKEVGLDVMWYIWCGPHSPVYGKDKMATFERYFLEDTATHVETKNPYCQLIDEEHVVTSILEEFELPPESSHIVNGHVPVEQKKGDTPIKCGGRLLMIDGGFCAVYQPITGIAGYTLVCSSRGMRIVSHDPFESAEKAIRSERDIHSEITVVEQAKVRMTVADTDTGKELKERITELEELLNAYRTGLLVENA